VAMHTGTHLFESRRWTIFFSARGGPASNRSSRGARRIT
jgi:hypothetical protein